MLLYGTRVHMNSCDAFTQTQLATAAMPTVVPTVAMPAVDNLDSAKTAAMPTVVPTVAMPAVDNLDSANTAVGSDTAATTATARRVQFAVSDSSSDEMVDQYDLFNSNSSIVSGDSVVEDGSADAALQYYVR
jgi:hypothetical protein